jgi:hypothetical protein
MFVLFRFNVIIVIFKFFNSTELNSLMQSILAGNAKFVLILLDDTGIRAFKDGFIRDVKDDFVRNFEVFYLDHE